MTEVIRNKIRANVNVDERTGCWEWKGIRCKGKRQYGFVWLGSRTDGSRRRVRAHRVSYEAFIGPAPASLCVCHHCDNPPCVNPQHLFLGTKKDNADDRDAKGRNSAAPTFYGEDAPWAKLTDEQIYDIRTSAVSSRKTAAAYGIGDSYVRQIRRGECRKVLTPSKAAVAYSLPAPPRALKQGGQE